MMKPIEWVEYKIREWSMSAFAWAITRGRDAEYKDLVKSSLETLQSFANDTIDRRHLERQVIEERLMRQFDPATAYNEAVNRAIEAKKAAREPMRQMTTMQQKAFEVQKATVTKALRNA